MPKENSPTDKTKNSKYVFAQRQGDDFSCIKLTEGKFLSWLSTKIKNENAKIVASPTLVLGENADPIFLINSLIKCFIRVQFS